jgi:hypothetical protein
MMSPLPSPTKGGVGWKLRGCDFHLHNARCGFPGQADRLSSDAIAHLHLVNGYGLLAASDPNPRHDPQRDQAALFVGREHGPFAVPTLKAAKVDHDGLNSRLEWHDRRHGLLARHTHGRLGRRKHHTQQHGHDRLALLHRRTS